MNQKRLNAYARITATVGANVQKGQGAVIFAQPEAADFVHRVTAACYEAGAAWVDCVYRDQAMELLAYRNQSLTELCRVPKWERERQRYWNRTLPAEIYLLSEDPDGLAEAPQDVLAQVRSRRSGILKPLRDERENRNQWTIAAVPGRAWARKVFPGVSEKKAVEQLWEAILAAARITDDPEGAWEAHNAVLQRRSQKLNGLQLTRVQLRSRRTGTDLTVGLIPSALWLGGAEQTLSGTRYNPNIPTEEIFTTPMRGAAEGTVTATKPLSFMGQVIEDFTITFREGRAVSCTAKRGQELLEKMLTLDENAAFLGEVALIGQDSPINQSGILFYETLFDENAACHLALGAGFPNTVADFADLSREELFARGVNDSVHHTDFMIGTDDLSVTGTTAGGKTVTLMKNGNWVL